MGKNIRVLHRVGCLNYAGLEMAVMSYYRNIDKSKVQFDFVAAQGKHRFEEEIISSGGKVYKTKYSRLRQPILYLKEFRKIIKDGNYNIVHLHNNSASIALEAIVCRMCKVPNIIVHSHNSGCELKLQHFIFRRVLNLFVDHFFACSVEAAEWMFGKKKARTNAVIMRNAIDVEKFRYNPLQRSNVRSLMDIEEKFVIGHIGGFNEAKNHDYIVDVFNEVYKKRKNAMLILVGDGKLRTVIEEKIKKLGLQDRVKFTGNITDVHNVTQGFDCFIFPSIFEGLGIVAIEAQASGLQCFVSKNVPKECKVSELVEFLDIDEEPKVWADKIIKFMDAEHIREDVIEQISKCGYNIKNQAAWLEEFYLSL